MQKLNPWNSLIFSIDKWRLPKQRLPASLSVTVVNRNRFWVTL